VIAAAGSQNKLDICKKYGGADYGVDYSKKEWQKEVLRITGGKGVDVVYYPVGLIAGRSTPWSAYHRRLIITAGQTVSNAYRGKAEHW
jgi:NADPH-dependent curcumin reductase CurA